MVEIEKVVDKAKIDAEKVQKTCNELSQTAAKTKAEIETDEKNILDIAKKEFKNLTIQKLKEELPNILNKNIESIEITVRELEKEIGISVNKIREAIDKLEEAGIIEIVKGGHRKPNTYRYIAD